MENIAWKKIVGCKNPYQSFSDWFWGRWKCPKCGTVWSSHMIMDDLTLNTMWKGVVIEKRLECLECGFKEVVWKRFDKND